LSTTPRPTDEQAPDQPETLEDLVERLEDPSRLLASRSDF
jgi:hypothetical protein